MSKIYVLTAEYCDDKFIEGVFSSYSAMLTYLWDTYSFESKVFKTDGGGNVPLLTDNETASQHKGKYIDKNDRLKYRKLTPLECERLQTVPDNWTECLSNTQRYKSLGNGWTIDVIVHILECAFK